MNAIEAKQLNNAAIPGKVTSTWADLGCGAGTFTNAVADLFGRSVKFGPFRTHTCSASLAEDAEA